MLSVIIAILGVGLIDLFKPIILDIPVVRINIYEDKLEKIKVGYSKSYVEDSLGVPQRQSKINWTSSEGNGYELTRVDYIQKDFLYTVFYGQDESVFGFGLISKNKNFNPRLPFNDSIPLLSKKQNDYLLNRHGEVRFSRYLLSGTRSDVSDYEIDFTYGHLSTKGLIIGYGISEFGYIKNSQAFTTYIMDYLHNIPDTETDFFGVHKLSVTGDKSFQEELDRYSRRIIDLENEHRKALIPNAVIVLDGNNDMYGDFYSTYDFIVQELRFGFLYYRYEL